MKGEDQREFHSGSPPLWCQGEVPKVGDPHGEPDGDIEAFLGETDRVTALLRDTWSAEFTNDAESRLSAGLTSRLRVAPIASPMVAS